MRLPARWPAVPGVVVSIAIALASAAPSAFAQGQGEGKEQAGSQLLAQPRKPAQEWATATPESQGMDPAALATLLEYGANVGMDSLVVARNGRIVAQAYYAPFRADMKHRINSATKGVVGMLTGIAIGRGELPPPQTPLAALLPRAAASPDARWGAVTLQDLLDMRSGIDWHEPLTDAAPQTMLDMARSRNWEEFILSRPMAQAPATAFDYNSGNPHLLSVLLTRRTREPADAYAQQHLFGPLGITDTRWGRDPQGVAIGGFGLYMHTRDMARLGQLYLQAGEWQGRQLVPREWVARVFAPRVDMGFPGWRYADFWWSMPSRGAYMMVGMNRQLVIVMPGLNLVAATTGRRNYPMEDLVAHLRRAAVSAQALPDDPQGGARLRAQVDAAARERPWPELADARRPPDAPVLKGAWRLEENALGVRELHFDFGAMPPAYRMVLRTREIAAPVGLDGRFAEGRDGGAPLFTRGGWIDASTLAVEQRWPEDAASVRYLMKFEGDALEITRTNDLGMTSVVRARRVAGG